MPRGWLFLPLWLAVGVVSAATPLPSGFAGVEVGHPWEAVEHLHPFENLAGPTTGWGKLVAQCGYRSLLASLGDGELMVTVNDFVVTDVSYTTSIEPESDLFEVAELVIRTYGQPSAAIMRDLLGQVTIDQDRTNFVTLEYDHHDPVVFFISGRGLWQYQIKVQLERYRWHENKTLRCAREKDAALNAGDTSAGAQETGGTGETPD